jgi:CDP-glycerol glycerophosphotransferase
MSRISVVVPIYNVERYLGECLQSIADQTFGDLEVVMVDDGSSDRSAAIATSFAERDPRFRLVTQDNGGLSKARNTGIEAATGEFLAFVDSDDLLPRRAYELLYGALAETKSDFATGNFHRITPSGTQKLTFASKAFARTRLETHITKFWPLLSDRAAWNKLWHRAFWDANRFRFPVGRVNEDISVTLPAHFKARSVDVIAKPVYYYRVRAGETLSITQRRLEPKQLIDRLAAVNHVTDFLAAEGPRGAKLKYDQNVVADDLRHYLNVLDSADEEYRTLFLDGANAFLDKASARIFEPLPAIERLKWHLVRRRLMRELVEVLRFQKEDLSSSMPVQVRGRWYGNYPYRTDRRLRIPQSVYRLDQELELTGEFEDMRVDGDRLIVTGYAYITGIGAPTPHTQKLQVIAVRPGRLRAIRLKMPEARLGVSVQRRQDLAPTGRLLSDPSWAGFEATLDLRALRGARGWKAGVWTLYVKARAGRLRRRKGRLSPSRFRPLHAIDLPLPPDLVGRAVPRPGNGAAVEIADEWVAVRSYRMVDDVLELGLDARLEGRRKLMLEVVRLGDEGVTHSYELATAAADDPMARLTARVPLADVLASPRLPSRTLHDDDREMWPIRVMHGKRRLPLVFPSGVAHGDWRFGDVRLSFGATKRGEAALIERALRPVVTMARWTDTGELDIAGELPDELPADEVVLVWQERVEHRRFALERASGRFTARLAPAAAESLAGPLPLAAGTWDVCVGRAGEQDEAAMVPVVIDKDLYDTLPRATTVSHKRFTLGATHDDLAILRVRRDLDDDEHGRYHQNRLHQRAYRPHRSAPLRDAVVYSSFDGQQYSDGPRAIHEELVRRAAPLEHLWVVRDGRARVPGSASVVRFGSREHYEALANARYVVTNDFLPKWFERRGDQVCVQTWHGTPLQRVGLDVPELSKATRPQLRRLDHQTANWQYVVSPNRFSTPILRRAYALDGEIIETGYPRDDQLAGHDLDAHTERLRRRLGLPGGRRVVLYAPTYREHAPGARGGYRLELGLDLELLSKAIGHDSVLLFRKHELVSDVVPSVEGFVYDASAYPDATELLLAADVLVTDYSPFMFDFANTGRPMLFYAYDFDAYEDEIGSFYVDYVDKVPGPLLRTTDDVADALNAVGDIPAQYAQRYSAFASEFCALDDGHAAARVVDRLFRR